MTMEISELVECKIKQGKDCLERLSSVNIDGISKLRNKIKQELNFLEKRLSSNIIKEEHLNCSNLTHLDAVATQLLKHENVCLSVMNNKSLSYDDGFIRKICVDLILYGGSVWMKVIARNRKALTLVSNGDCSFGQKSILDQAEEFIECSRQNIHYFKPPTVVFFFACGIEDCLAKELSNIGIQVETNVEKLNDEFHSTDNRIEDNFIPMVEEEFETMKDLKLIREMAVSKLNLGVTTMIAYVSNLTNGSCNLNFESDILRKHAEWEKARPVKPILDALFEGRALYCCKTAADNFRSILDVLGGKNERVRGEELLKRITVVEDHPAPELRAGGKVKERSLAIFGTGRYLRAVTVTANHAFIRSAMNKGIYFEVFLHESRALTEGKELP